MEAFIALFCFFKAGIYERKTFQSQQTKKFCIGDAEKFSRFTKTQIPLLTLLDNKILIQNSFQRVQTFKTLGNVIGDFYGYRCHVFLL